MVPRARGALGFDLSDGSHPPDANCQSFFHRPGGATRVIDMIHSFVAGLKAVTSITF